MSRTEKFAVGAFVFISLAYIISSAYLGINGNHAWRQADTYGHILGFIGYKDFEPYDRFLSDIKAVYDIPLYQFVIAKISSLYTADPLVVTRFVNAFFWAIMAYCGYCLAASIGSTASGLIFLFSLSASPLILHYYSSPLPDVMAIALSLAAITILHRYGTGWVPAIYAFPFLAVATLIKSPVPFIFVLFYVSFYILHKNIKISEISGYIRNNLPALLVLAALALLALIAEQLRSLLLGRDGLGFAQSPAWYFGPVEMRLHPEFWGLAWKRFHEWGPFAFGYVYLLTVAASLILCSDRRNVILVRSSVVAFVSGWLIFSNVYLYHNYYQIPLAIIVLISFSVSFSLLIDRYSVVTWKNWKINTKIPALVALVLFATQYVLLSGNLSDRTRVRIFSGIEYALRGRDVALYIKDEYDGPAVGGEVSTKVKRISHREFELSCEAYLARYDSVISDGFSICLDRNKATANYYVRDEGFQFFRKG